MSVRPLRAWRRPGQLLGVEALKSDEEEDCLQPLSLCPACSRACDVVLVLPCSHAMCAGCIAAAQGTRSGPPRRRRRGPAVCSVPCPCCRHPVELPCWTWSSATSCLPTHPVGVGEEADREGGASGGQLQHLQGNSYFLDAPSRSHGEFIDVFIGLSASQNEPFVICGHERLHPGCSCLAAPVEGAVDLREEEMERSVFGLCFALDPSSLPPSLHLSNSSLTVTYRGESGAAAARSTTSDPGLAPPALPQVRGDVAVARGQYYWEVDVCNSSVYRIGVSSLDGSGGWWLERLGPSYSAVYDGSREPLRSVPPQLKTLGVFLNLGGGGLSFHNPLTREHLATLPTRFHPAGVLPALGLGQGRLRLRSGLPPPAHVFLSRHSAYRGPGEGQLRHLGEFPFQSVRKTVRKFEELAGFRSSSSASRPDRGSPPSGGPEAGQETHG